MYQKKSRRAARSNRFIAITLTLMFHAVIIGAIAFSGNDKGADIVPAKVKEWLGMEETPAEIVAEEKDERPRP